MKISRLPESKRQDGFKDLSIRFERVRSWIAKVAFFFCPFQRTAIRHAFRGVIKESAEQHDASGLSGVRSGARRGPAGGCGTV